MKDTLYYVVNLHLDETYSWNGLRTITGYQLCDDIPIGLVTMFEILAKSDGDYNYILSDEEEIQNWLDDNEFEMYDFEMTQL